MMQNYPVDVVLVLDGSGLRRLTYPQMGRRLLTAPESDGHLSISPFNVDFKPLLCSGIP
jgi:hypothetical protein